MNQSNGSSPISCGPVTAGVFGRWTDNAPVGDIVPFYDLGTYHLFCLTPPLNSLYYPERLRTTWRHLSSPDLVHWQRLPDALAPGAESDPDGGGIWTGSVLRTDDGYHIFYTGHAAGAEHKQSVCHATSADCVIWNKDPSNPVSVPELDKFSGQDWRDPFVFWHAAEECYWMLLSARSAAGSAPVRGAVALRTSPDLRSWSETTVLYETFLTHCPECPEVFRLADKWIMAYSRFTDRPGTVYRFADNPRGPWHSFSHDRLDGRHWYAAKSVTDDAGRRIAFGWVPDRNPAITPETGQWLWGGDLAVPREIVLEDGELGVRLPAEMGECERSELAYTAAYMTGEWSSDDGGSFSVVAPGHFGHCLIESAEPADNYILSAAVSWSAGTAIVGVAVRVTANLDRGIAVLCYPGEGVVRAVELGPPSAVSDSPADAEPPAADYSPVAEGRLPRHMPGRMPFRIVVRGDIVEAFVGDATCLSYRMSSADAGHVALLAQDGLARFSDVEWHIVAQSH
jgi:beta-fructofuranosidase